MVREQACQRCVLNRLRAAWRQGALLAQQTFSARDEQSFSEAEGRTRSTISATRFLTSLGALRVTAKRTARTALRVGAWQVHAALDALSHCLLC